MKIYSLKRAVVLILAVFLLPDFFQPTSIKSPVQAAPTAVRAPEVVKVGITEYQKIEDSYDRYERLFQQLSEYADPKQPVTFSFAIGNYAEVLDWYNNGLIDVAILSAMPVADMLNSAGPADLNKIDEAYLGDVSVTRTPSKSNPNIVSLFPKLDAPDPFKYRTGCIVLDSDKRLKTIEDIRGLWKQDQVKFLFVRPYSMSGYILPMATLHKNGIYPRPDQLKFTYEHSKSLEQMSKSLTDPSVVGGKHPVAFVLDTTNAPSDALQIFRRIDIPELNSYAIPREIILANYHQEKDTLEKSEGFPNRFQKYKALMIHLLANWKSPPVIPAKVPVLAAGNPNISVALRRGADNWRQGYDKEREALKEIELPRELLYRSTLSDLFNDLAGDIDRGNSPRLALVLSGGGAKCAYQAGAVVEIEKKLKEMNADRGNKLPLDIGLVVGTSGGAINALLVGLGVTRTENAPEKMAKMWSSFKQQQFFQPSRRFNLVFGLCFGLLQALFITVAVLLFGRQSLNWFMTGLLLVGIGALEVAACRYFGVAWRTVGWVLATEAVFLGLIIAIVLAMGFLIDVIENRWEKRRGSVGADESRKALRDQNHWRWLTIVLMLAFSSLEWLIAKLPGLDARVSAFGKNHWLDHIWMFLTLICNWSFPYPLAIALLMVLVGGVIWQTFDWNQRRETFVWWMTIILIAVSAGLVLEAFFRENAPSKAQGIETAFAEYIPELIRETVNPQFRPSPSREGETALQSISRQLMDENAPMLQHDLVITTSRLPMNASAANINAQSAERVNNLPDDLYFYFRHNRDDRLKPPLDKRLIPFKHNPDKLLDVVIGSSTIYPIFPSRVLRNVSLGNEEMQAPQPLERMNIIDGGFIHNIPIEAAGLWKASHIILIEASPRQRQNEPRHFWDNTMLAFGYLFSQAQRSDKLARGSAETFELRPTSKCEKLNSFPGCTGSDDLPEPDMDTFDFSDELVNRAFKMGRDDVANETPLFVRVPGPPLFRTLPSRAPTRRRTRNRRV
jgi:predicted acylesterase/phospholipase RssA/ABC-type phosphate/phosphonate transport system substrate-binding protein